MVFRGGRVSVIFGQHRTTGLDSTPIRSLKTFKLFNFDFIAFILLFENLIYCNYKTFFLFLTNS